MIKQCFNGVPIDALQKRTFHITSVVRLQAGKLQDFPLLQFTHMDFLLPLARPKFLYWQFDTEHQKVPVSQKHKESFLIYTVRYFILRAAPSKPWPAKRRVTVAVGKMLRHKPENHTLTTSTGDAESD